MRRRLPALRLAGLVLGLLVLAWWPASTKWSWGALSPYGCVDVEHGAIYIEPGVSQPWDCALRADVGPPYEQLAGRPVERWKPLRVLRWDPSVARGLYVVPLWVPAVLLALPWLWSRWRRRSAGPQGRGFEVRAGGPEV